MKGQRKSTRGSKSLPVDDIKINKDQDDRNDPEDRHGDESKQNKQMTRGRKRSKGEVTSRSRSTNNGGKRVKKQEASNSASKGVKN